MGSPRTDNKPAVAPSSSAAPAPGPAAPAPRKRKGHRGGKKRKARRKSFAAPLDDVSRGNQSDTFSDGRDDFYLHGHNLSGTSMDSEALLDHRDQQQTLRPRRPSVLTLTNASNKSPFAVPQTASRLRTVVAGGDSNEDEDEDERDPWNEGAPLLSQSMHYRADTFGGYGSADAVRRGGSQSRPNSSRASSKRRKALNPFTPIRSDSYNVNYPPSMPASPQMRPLDRMDMSFGDLLLRAELESAQRSPRTGMDEGTGQQEGPGSFLPPALERRHTIALDAEGDVCFPQEGLSELGDDELHGRDPAEFRMRSRRRRGKWPDLSILDEWRQFEEEGRIEERGAKRITEPHLINGRLRPVNKSWFRTEEDAPYRFTYFNEEFPSTIHSQTISELVQPGVYPGGSFRELFIPDPPVLSDSSDDEDDQETAQTIAMHPVVGGQNGDSKTPTREPSLAATIQSQLDSARSRTLSPSNNGKGSHGSKQSSGSQTPDIRSPHVKSPEQLKTPKPVRHGDRPVWWLDVLSPTEAEMKVISKAFGIHPLTAEDILVQEQREKVELFRNYYFVNYRSFDQDQNSENFLEPVNMYVVVFREGVLSFHFSITPHPANVRRRIRQLSDYLVLSPDWISYAIIDDITDVFVPLIQNIEDEVDDIDDAILQLHSSSDPASSSSNKDGGRSGEKSEAGEASAAESGRDMLRRVGDCRKKVMLLYRLLGNKADVIKGFAKRCNEHWDVAPRSDIGLYLGDIQDHIVTMTANLTHYEKILARSHGNYLAQINIRMNERQEQTADVLGKLTVLGTIVLPMNVFTGLFGMNVWVPGQDKEGDLGWFLAITASMILFGAACYLVAKRVYKIV